MDDISQLAGLPSPVDLLPTDVVVVFRNGVPYRVSMQAVKTEAEGGALLAANNLSDVATPATALANLGAEAAGAAAAAQAAAIAASDPVGAGAAAVAGLNATAAGLALLQAADLAAQKTILGIA
jgi:hypothetical protein